LPRHAAWRDPIVAWLDAPLRARKEAAEKKLLHEVERKTREAKGRTAAEANARAEELADALVNAAGDWVDAPLIDVDPSDLQHFIRTDVTGAVQITRAILPALRDAGALW